MSGFYTFDEKARREMHPLLLFAQQNEISLTSATGWGAFGLAVLILCWIAFYLLPGFDSKMEKKDQQVMQVIDKHAVESEKQRAAFTTALDRVVNHCKEESAALWERLDR